MDAPVRRSWDDNFDISYNFGVEIRSICARYDMIEATFLEQPSFKHSWEWPSCLKTLLRRQVWHHFWNLLEYITLYNTSDTLSILGKTLLVRDL